MYCARKTNDFYSVFLKVELSCNGDLPVRILGSFAKPSTYYLVESQSEMKQCALTLFPRQTVSFIYKLVKRDNKSDTDDDNVNSKIHFYVKYRSLKDGNIDFLMYYNYTI
jgi:hypothetical protein